MKKALKEVESAGVQASVAFAVTVTAGSFLLGIYNLIGLESEIPALAPIAKSLGYWWFAVSLGGFLLYRVNRFASKLPSPFE